MHQEPFDPTFDTASDAGGRDPDKYSARLHSAHLLLWSKPLPSGQLFELNDAGPAGYLRHEPALGTFHLGSDSIIHTYRRAALRPILDALEPSELDRFVRVAHMIGGYHLFPLGNGRSPNQIRGFDKKATIDDRFDLALECIRLHYEGLDNELTEVLSRYREFFCLFRDFRGYVDFFLLQDLVTEDCSAVKFFMPFNDFMTPSVPKDGDAYRTKVFARGFALEEIFTKRRELRRVGDEL